MNSESFHEIISQMAVDEALGGEDADLLDMISEWDNFINDCREHDQILTQLAETARYWIDQVRTRIITAYGPQKESN